MVAYTLFGLTDIKIHGGMRASRPTLKSAFAEQLSLGSFGKGEAPKRRRWRMKRGAEVKKQGV